jgi:putative SOS response-associated peptidase YedK
MCNLYSITKGPQAIREFANATLDTTGNLPPLPEVYPDFAAPAVRNTPDGKRELAMLRWGMPTPPEFRKGPVDRGVTNIRNVGSLHWRAWLGVAHRCIVPAESFCEPTDAPNPATGKKDWAWFALSEDRPLFFFAGLWCTWHGVRGMKSKPEEGKHELFAFLTTAPNEIVKPVHSKAMPVMLTTVDEIETWMTAPAHVALQLQRPLPTQMIRIVAMGKEDAGALGRGNSS